MDEPQIGKVEYGPGHPRSEWSTVDPRAESIYTALNGLVSAQRDLIHMMRNGLASQERAEEELREAHLELANALNRRLDALHTRIDEMEGKR